MPAAPKNDRRTLTNNKRSFYPSIYVRWVFNGRTHTHTHTCTRNTRTRTHKHARTYKIKRHHWVDGWMRLNLLNWAATCATYWINAAAPSVCQHRRQHFRQCLTTSSTLARGNSKTDASAALRAAALVAVQPGCHLGRVGDRT